MKRGWLGLLLALTLAAPARAELQATQLESIAPMVEAEIAARHIPGAVVLVGQDTRVVYLRAFGLRVAVPDPEPMTTDTVFDLASLTKVVATTPAVLHLVDQGLLQLDAPVARYWPDFAAQDKGSITVRQLLAHTSGLPAGIDTRPNEDAAALLQRVAQVTPRTPYTGAPLYSDLNFIVLSELVRRVSGMPFDRYVQQAVLQPLGMRDTAFMPPPSWLGRTAPTVGPANEVRRARVHDPLADRLGGVAGNAGLFSTAADLARFCQAVLRDGNGVWSGPLNTALFTPQTVVTQTPRTLGWDAQPPLAANRAALPPLGAIGHLGYTGTGIWIDPISHVYVIVLSNRLHPDGRGDANPLRIRTVHAVASALEALPPQTIAQHWPRLAARVAPYLPAPVEQPVKTGIDVLESAHFAPLLGRRIALLTHRAGVDSAGRRTIDVLANAPGVELRALFSPEHGLGGNREGAIADDTDDQTGLPVYSLYGRPSALLEQRLAGLDAVVVDLQDAGVRFYTYASTVVQLLRAAAAQGVAVVVLDRPNPLNGATLQGPLLDDDLRSFTAIWNVPLRHGLTLGEFARLYRAENQLTADLTVVPMQGYRRAMGFEQTGLPWLPPSPNLTGLTAAQLYPGVGMIEGADVSVGRGTDTPFEVVGAPWIDAQQLTQALQRLPLPGVSFTPTEFEPVASRYAGLLCHGVRITLSNRDTLDTAELGLALAQTLHQLYPDRFKLEPLLGSIGSRATLDALRDGRAPHAIARDWQAALQAFEQRRAPYLLYH